jgi:hypothetical protein
MATAGSFGWKEKNVSKERKADASHLRRIAAQGRDSITKPNKTIQNGH